MSQLIEQEQLLGNYLGDSPTLKNINAIALLA